jgi:hypothetical protein
MLHKQGVLRFIKFATVMIIFTLMITPVLAVDPPLIRVAPQWRPATTLDSIDAFPLNTMGAGDDFRYVDVDIYVTASVQFWTAQLNCTVAPAALTTYETPNFVNSDPGDNVAVVRWGPDMGIEGNDFTSVVEPFTATGSRRFTAAKYYGPIGGNGWNNTFLLATLRYRAKDIAANTTSPFTCVTTFLNKDGRVVLAPVYVAPPALSVITGYTINARATYQGRTVHSGVAVTCYNSQGQISATSTTGNFILNGLRVQGWYDCYFFGNITNPVAGYQPDTYLQTGTSFLLGGSSYQLLPHELLGGNVSRNGANTDGNAATEDEIINGDDLGVITAPANWEKLTAVGDVNADTFTNRADLAITAGNMGNSETTYYLHGIYSLARNWDSWRNSRIWLGTQWSGHVNQFVSGNNKDYWATLSPDGTKLAFARGVGPSDCPHCTTAIFVAPVNNQGIVGAAVRVTPATNWYSNNYAPSWSPDGTQIAFSCTWWDDVIGGYGYNDGNLCVVTTTGTNLRTVAWNARIYPPAWYVNNIGENYLVYGGSYLNSNCANTLCIKSPSTPEGYSPGVFDTDIDAGGATGRIADMPRICNMRGCDVLFYRYDNGTTSLLRFAEIDIDNTDVFNDANIPPWTTREAATISPYHLELETYDGFDMVPIATDVDYYTVHQNGYDIILTRENNGWDFFHFGSDWLDKSWWDGGWNSVFDTVPNIDPMFDPDPSERYALRNTVDIVP